MRSPMVPVPGEQGEHVLSPQRQFYMVSSSSLNTQVTSTIGAILPCLLMRCAMIVTNGSNTSLTGSC